jgi:hypothetical protein
MMKRVKIFARYVQLVIVLIKLRVEVFQNAYLHKSVTMCQLQVVPSLNVLSDTIKISLDR